MNETFRKKRDEIDKLVRKVIKIAIDEYNVNPIELKALCHSFIQGVSASFSEAILRMAVKMRESEREKKWRDKK